MGYSARYHAASLAAVFLALAIGILIGAEFGGDVVSNTRKDLEKSLTANLADARGRADELAGELGRANEFADRIYPVLVSDKLAGRRIGILALGGLPGGLSNDDRGRAGADRGEPGRGRGDPRAARPRRARRRPLGDPLRRPRIEPRHGAGARDRVRAPAGDRRQPAGEGRQPDLLARQRPLRRPRRRRRRPRPPQDLDNAEAESVSRLESGAARRDQRHRGQRRRGRGERRRPSSISFFQEHDLSTVDDIDLASGKVATVFALLGAEGSFGDQGQRRPAASRPPGPGPGRARSGRAGRGQRRELGRRLGALRRRPGQVTWVGFPVAIAVGLLVVPAGVRGLLDAGPDPRELPRQR